MERPAATRRLNLEADEECDLETRAATLCRIYGAGSEEYSAFLEQVNSTLLGAMLELPKFVPGDIKNGAASKSRRKKKHSRRKTQLSVVKETLLGSQTPPVNESETQIAPEPLESVVEEGVGRQEGKVEATTVAPSRTVQRSMTQVPTRDRRQRNSAQALRRSQSVFDAAEQVTMDEQVALQLQTLVHEKAELIKENSRLKNENEGLKTLLEYATCEATAEEDSDYEATKEVLRHPGIQAWHPPELQSPTSFSSYGLMGSTSSSNDDKEPHVTSQASDETYPLSQLHA